MMTDPAAWAEEWLSLARSHTPTPRANSANSANSSEGRGFPSVSDAGGIHANSAISANSYTDAIKEHAEARQDRANGTIGTNGTASTDLRTDLAARADRAAEAVASMADDADERAAIAEFDGGMPREWAEGFARLQTMPVPDGFTPRRWARLLDDAGLFLDQWAATASTLGWDTADVWGVHPTRPLARYDHMGLIGLLDGARVVALTRDTATLRTASGATNTAHRRPVAGAVPVWELGA